MMETKRDWKQGRSLPRRFQYAAIVILVLGIFLRLYHLDYKVYWLDEAYTSLRLAGYTRAEFVQNVFTGEVVGVDALQHYQYPNPDRGLTDTLKSIAAEEPQITPLYFVLSRFWVEGLGNSVAVMRSLPALLSLFAFPCLWWLCWELFQSAETGWLAIALFSLSPLHVLYAQEARPYSLWTVTILLSSAVLLWAIRTKTRLSWAAYALTVALGLYTQLLFGLVAIAHSIYVVFSRLQPPLPTHKWRFSKTIAAYLLSTLAGCLTLLPWLLLLFGNLDEAQARTASLSESTPLTTVISQWFVNNSRVFIGWDLGLANLLPVIGVVYALYFLCRSTPRRIWLFILTLVGVTFLVLALPDLVWGGARSTRIRYLIPCYLGIQIALAHLFATYLPATHLPATHLPATQAVWLTTKRLTTKKQQWSRVALGVLLSTSLAACLISAQSRVWWNKSVPRSSYYPPVSKIINHADRPLVIADGHPIDLLALSYWLDSNVRFQLINEPKTLRIATGFQPIFLLNPSEKLRSILTRRGYDLKSIYNDRHAPKEDEERLWHVQRN